MRKPRTVALSAGSPLAAGAAAAHDPPRPIQPGGRAKRRGRDQRPPDHRDPDAARGYVHALTWSSGTIAEGSAAAHPPQAGESPPRGQRRPAWKRAFLLTAAGGLMGCPKRRAVRAIGLLAAAGEGARLGWPRAAPAAAGKAAATAGPRATGISTGPDARAGR